MCDGKCGSGCCKRKGVEDQTPVDQSTYVRELEDAILRLNELMCRDANITVMSVLDALAKKIQAKRGQ